MDTQRAFELSETKIQIVAPIDAIFPILIFFELQGLKLSPNNVSFQIDLFGELSMSANESPDAQKAGFLLLRIGTALFSAGANTERIYTTLNRIASALGFEAGVHLVDRVLHLQLIDKANQQPVFRQLQRTTGYRNNFTLISGISRMSWNIVEEKWSLGQIQSEVDRLFSLPLYPRWVSFGLVALAGASFCRLFGGGLYDMLTVFLATTVGLSALEIAKQWMFNSYLSIYVASLVSSFTTLLLIHSGIGIDREHTLPAALIFMVPGVPLINAFSDLIDGHTLNGLIRTLNGLMIAFSIALGLLTAFFILPLS